MKHESATAKEITVIEFKFSCSHCDQHIAYDESCFGQSVHCPNCQQVITVPAGPAASHRLGLRVSELVARPPTVAPTPPYAPQQPPQQKLRSSLAVASLVLSLLSLILGPLGYIPGIICGHLAKKRLRRDTGLTGAGLANAGLVIGYLGLVVTIALVGLTLAGSGRSIPVSAAETPSPHASESGENTVATGGAPRVAEPAPVSVQVQNFRPKAAGKKGGFTLMIENHARKTVERLEFRMEYRDADGVSEKDVPNTLQQTFPPKTPTKEEQDDFFMLPTTRGVTVSVRKVSFADGSTWSPLKAAMAVVPPGALSFAGHEAPASAEMIRFRPNVAKKGHIAARFINHSNKAIQAFIIEITCLDADGKKVDSLSPGWNFGSPDLVIEPGGVFEFSTDAPNMKERARSATFGVRELTFVGGEKWTPARK